MKYYTFSEFSQMNNSNLIKIDKLIGHIRRNKKLYTQLILIIAIITLPRYSLAVDINLSKIDNFGMKALKIVRAIGYWAIIVKGGADIVGHASQGDAKGAFRCAFGYVTIFAILFLFPMMLDLVKEAFN